MKHQPASAKTAQWVNRIQGRTAFFESILSKYGGVFPMRILPVSLVYGRRRGGQTFRRLAAANSRLVLRILSHTNTERIKQLRFVENFYHPLAEVHSSGRVASQREVAGASSSNVLAQKAANDRTGGSGLLFPQALASSVPLSFGLQQKYGPNVVQRILSQSVHFGTARNTVQNVGTLRTTLERMYGKNVAQRLLSQTTNVPPLLNRHSARLVHPARRRTLSLLHAVSLHRQSVKPSSPLLWQLGDLMPVRVSSEPLIRLTSRSSIEERIFDHYRRVPTQLLFFLERMYGPSGVSRLVSQAINAGNTVKTPNSAEPLKSTFVPEMPGSVLGRAWNRLTGMSSIGQTTFGDLQGVTAQLLFSLERIYGPDAVQRILRQVINVGTAVSTSNSTELLRTMFVRDLLGSVRGRTSGRLTSGSSSGQSPFSQAWQVSAPSLFLLQRMGGGEVVPRILGQARNAGTGVSAPNSTELLRSMFVREMVHFVRGTTSSRFTSGSSIGQVLFSQTWQVSAPVPFLLERLYGSGAVPRILRQARNTGSGVSAPNSTELLRSKFVREMAHFVRGRTSRLSTSGSSIGQAPFGQTWQVSAPVPFLLERLYGSGAVPRILSQSLDFGKAPHTVQSHAILGSTAFVRERRDSLFTREMTINVASKYLSVKTRPSIAAGEHFSQPRVGRRLMALAIPLLQRNLNQSAQLELQVLRRLQNLQHLQPHRTDSRMSAQVSLRADSPSQQMSQVYLRLTAERRARREQAGFARSVLPMQELLGHRPTPHAVFLDWKVLQRNEQMDSSIGQDRNSTSQGTALVATLLAKNFSITSFGARKNHVAQQPIHAVSYVKQSIQEQVMQWFDNRRQGLDAKILGRRSGAALPGKAARVGALRLLVAWDRSNNFFSSHVSRRPAFVEAVKVSAAALPQMVMLLQRYQLAASMPLNYRETRRSSNRTSPRNADRSFVGRNQGMKRFPSTPLAGMASAGLFDTNAVQRASLGDVRFLTFRANGAQVFHWTQSMARHSSLLGQAHSARNVISTERTKHVTAVSFVRGKQAQVPAQEIFTSNFGNLERRLWHPGMPSERASLRLFRTTGGSTTVVKTGTGAVLEKMTVWEGFMRQIQQRALQLSHRATAPVVETGKMAILLRNAEIDHRGTPYPLPKFSGVRMADARSGKGAPTSEVAEQPLLLHRLDNSMEGLRATLVKDLKATETQATAAATPEVPVRSTQAAFDFRRSLRRMKSSEVRMLVNHIYKEVVEKMRLEQQRRGMKF